MTLEELCNYLTQRGLKFDVVDIDHGKQVRVQSGEKIAVYNSGKVVPGGSKTPLRQEIEAWKESGFLPAATGADDTQPEADQRAPLSTDIFIVYGHDTGARDGLELMLRRMGLNPIVLANLPAAGDTIIEKLEKYLRDAGNVGFACVLLTPDDEGHRVGADEEKKYRARQNVILELGMALARVGRKRVAILYKESVERPSDIDGLIYLPFKEHVSEVKPLLFRELKAAGYTPDPTAL